MAFPHLSTDRSPQSSAFPSFAAPGGQTTARDGIGWRWQILVFLLAAAVVISRRPDAITHPQFFAEDGPVWYANAYKFGWFHSLFQSQNGYFQTLPRLAASLALLVPLRDAPLLMNLIGITFQVLPVCVLLSWRCSNWASLPTRCFMAAAYLALPNTMELDASVEEGQWHLALLACMLILSRPPGKRWLWSALDAIIILLSGVTGPFCIVLLPIALYYWWIRRGTFRLVTFSVLAITALIQLSAILRTSAGTRPGVGLGATPKLFIDMLGGRVFLGAILGQGALRANTNVFLLCAVVIGGTALLVYCLVRASVELRLFIVFAFLLFLVSLRNPMVSMTEPQWQILRDAGGIRYWFFPMLAFVWALISNSRENSHGLIRVISVAGLMCMLIGITRDWKYPAYPDNHFSDMADRFEASTPGTLVTIPIYPPGWRLLLPRKGPACSVLPVGSIDQPAAGATVGDHLAVSGWVVAVIPVRRIDVLIDRIAVGSATPTISRADIDKIYPQSPDNTKGWTATAVLPQLSPGKHEIEARAVLADGCQSDFFMVPVMSAAK